MYFFDIRMERLQPGLATRIMTGAPVPSGADAVVMVEQTRTSRDAAAVDWVEVAQN